MRYSVTEIILRLIDRRFHWRTGRRRSTCGVNAGNRRGRLAGHACGRLVRLFDGKRGADHTKPLTQGRNLPSETGK